jgi:ClpP class serine protease
MLKNSAAMSKSPSFTHPWLPAGIVALDTSALAHEEAMGNLTNPAAAHGSPLRAMGEDPNDLLVKETEKRCGLQKFPGLGIAVQPVCGVMAAGASRIAECCGMFNTERIGRACREVAADAQMQVMILAFESPGGYTAGVEEAAAAVQALPAMRKGLAVIGYTARLCASAAEWVSFACERHYAAPSATLGSIGIIASITDSSRAFREAGLERFVATDGKYKDMGMPGVPVRDEHKAFLTAGVMETSAAFKGYLRSRRGITDEAMQGQTFPARKAPAGFCDGTQFESLEELMAVIAAGQL